MVDLSPILDIRNTRLDDLRKDEKAETAAYADATREVHEARTRMEDYAREILTLEVDLLRELVGTELTNADFAKFKAKLEEAEKKAKELAEDLRLANERMAEAERSLLKARQARVQAQSKVNRIGELKKILDEERRAEAIAREDAEGDDFVDMMPRRRGLF
ncbi:MAG: type III secretion protein [Rhodobacteraceae bacterium]|nr:type III secretion protein [Paracoccaceae bacterium]